MKENKTIPVMEQKANSYFVFCKGGQSKFNKKEQAIRHIMQKELFYSVRLYETVDVDVNGFDNLKCIYFTGCGKKCEEI